MNRQALIVKSRTEQVVEARIGEPIDVALRRLYLAEGLTQAEVASQLGVTRQAVIRWMDKYGIESRPTTALLSGAA